MRFLLIDNSNTRTKFTIGTADALEPWIERVNTADISVESLEHVVADQNFDAVLLCSVVPSKAEVMERFFNSIPFKRLSYQSKLGIQIDYPNPEQIGADRLANAVGVHALFGSPAIVIDFGTAVTFDVVGENATYLGGVISPGLASMTDNLAKRTALLPTIELTEPRSAIGKSTTEAMQAGAMFGYRGMIKEIIYRLKSEMTGNPVVVATGGDAELISRGMDEIDHVCPALTLEGIRIAAIQQF